MLAPRPVDRRLRTHHPFRKRQALSSINDPALTPSHHTTSENWMRSEQTNLLPLELRCGFTDCKSITGSTTSTSPSGKVSPLGTTPFRYVTAKISEQKAFVALTLLGLVSVAAAMWSGLSFQGMAWLAFVVASLFLLSWFYTTIRPRQPLAEMAAYSAGWIAFTLLGSTLTYSAVVIGASRPLFDVQLAKLDVVLGLDWFGWANSVRSSPILELALDLAYQSLIVQIILSVAVLSFGRQRGRKSGTPVGRRDLVVTDGRRLRALPSPGAMVVLSFHPGRSERIALSLTTSPRCVLAQSINVLFD